MQNLIIKVDCAQQKYIHESSPTLLKRDPGTGVFLRIL